jgi:hypothetical protein
MRREIGVSSGSAGVDEVQLTELIDEGTYGKVFSGEPYHTTYVRCRIFQIVEYMVPGSAARCV